MWQKQVCFTVSSMLAFSSMCSLLFMLPGSQVCFSYDLCFPVRRQVEHIYIDLFHNSKCKNIVQAHCTLCCFYFHLLNASKTV